MEEERKNNGKGWSEMRKRTPVRAPNETYIKSLLQAATGTHGPSLFCQIIYPTIKS